MDIKISREYINAIVQHKSISAAAKRLGISQPALSSYLRKLEIQFDATFFNRAKKPLELTEEGRLFLEYTEKHYALNRELTQLISDIQNLKHGNLAIGGAAFFNVTYLPKAVADFAQAYPEIDLEIINGNIPEIAMKAMKGYVDVFITPNNEDVERFSYEKLLSEQIYLVVPELSDGGEIQKADLKDFSDMTFITLKEDQHIGRVMEELFQKYDFVPRHTIVTEQTMTSYALTMAGAGASLITESSLRSILFSQGLQKPGFNVEGSSFKIYSIDSEICCRDIYIAYPNNRHLSRAAQEFIRILKNDKRM